MTATLYRLQDFVDEARDIVGRGLSDDATLEAIVEPLSRIIARPDCLADLEPSGNPNPDKGFTIFEAPNLSILAVVWPENGGAPIHNHNGWAIEGVISGFERNRNFERRDDGKTPWRAQLEEVEPTYVPAGTTTCLALPPHDIHAVEIPQGKTLAIHVYGIDLLHQWRYQFDLATGDVVPYRRASSVK